ncbi:HAMP domain-containing protein [Deferribacteraceae bacterium V6Fe1]|nr:HAMP domain-containing protein [Deferribacteraceae bacterium V6Fe1]
MKKLSTKLAFKLAIVLLVIIGVGSYYLIATESQRLKQQLLERGRLASIVGAKTVGKILDEAIDNGVLTLNDIFDTDYQKIGDFNPPKYHTKYDFYTDKAILEIEDSFLTDENVVFAVAVDINGYLPTHNTKYQKALTGSAEDLEGNRTKRIFDDKVGLLAAQNKNYGFLQTYYRDTGEVMWDISSPIYVKGKHWGGFRIGFSLEKTNMQIKNLKYTIFGIFLLIVLVSISFVYVVVNSSLKPLSILTKQANDFADGKVDNKMIYFDRNDEIGEISKAFERLRTRLFRTNKNQ